MKKVDKILVAKWDELLEKYKDNPRVPRRAAYALKHFPELHARAQDLLHYHGFKHTQKIIDLLKDPSVCEVCNGPCSEHHYHICTPCWSSDRKKYSKLRKDRAHKAAQSKRASSWAARTDEQKTNTLKQYRSTMAERFEGGHNTRDPKHRELRRKKNGFLSPFEDPEIREKARQSFMARSGIGAPGHKAYLKKREATCIRLYGVRAVTQDPEIARKALESSQATRELRVGKHKFKVQSGSEETVLRYLCEVYGAQNVITQFSKGYPMAAAKAMKWLPDFWIKPVADEPGFFVECKSTYTLYDKKEWLDSNRKKAKAAGTQVRWIVDGTDSLYWLPHDWFRRSRIALIILCEDYTARRYLRTLEAIEGAARVDSNVVKINDVRIVVASYADDLKDLQTEDVRTVILWPHEIRQHPKAVIGLTKAILNVKTKSVGARKLRVQNVGAAEAKTFLDQYHLQGSTGSSVRLGLFLEDKLLSIASFRKPVTQSECPWELARFCTRPGWRVQGGLSKLLKAFKETAKYKEKPGALLSFADARWSNGGVYTSVGFENKGTSSPGYFWRSGTHILSRYATQKKKLPALLGDAYDPELSEVQNMIRCGWTQVRDCGQHRFVLP